jgi:5S rRNA maturation endonuclease (ribonuclease M5)
MKTLERDELLTLIDELKRYEGIIIVEGKKDVRALSWFGIRAISLNESIDAQFEKLGTDRPVLILTDRDREGRALASQALSACERLGLVPDGRMRTRFFAVTGIRHVEAFDTICVRAGIGSDRNARYEPL